MKQVMFIELGMGVDLQGQDTTKAATRAVRDAIQRNYMPGIRRLLEDRTAGCWCMSGWASPADAAPPDLEAVRASLPHGEVTVELVPGGMLGAQRTGRWRPDLRGQRGGRGLRRDLTAGTSARRRPPPAAAS